MGEAKSEAVIRVRELVVGFDRVTVLDHMSLDVFGGKFWARWRVGSGQICTDRAPYLG